jgi:hypothetical protein
MKNIPDRVAIRFRCYAYFRHDFLMNSRPTGSSISARGNTHTLHLASNVTGTVVTHSRPGVAFHC